MSCKGASMRKVALFLLSLGMAMTTLAAPPEHDQATSATALPHAQSPKPPWRWTLDERLSAINDPAAAAERLRVAQGRPGWPRAKRAPNANPGPSDQVDFISGRDHPELLLPWELFDHMMKMAYADDPEVRSVFREAKSPALTGSGLAADFWNRLEAFSVAYLSDVRQLHDLHKRRVSDAAVQRRIELQSAALENLKCRDRAAAIA